MDGTGVGRGMRRLCAIMFADIEGYTALMQRDESAAIASRHRFQSIIEARVVEAGGEVVQFYGDGALSIFPSAVEASRCSIAIQRLLHQEPRVPVRVGIHVGDIVRDREGAWGDGVNVSARIQALAPAGSVLASKRVVGELKNHPGFDVVRMGRFTLKNVADPVEVFALVDAEITVPDPTSVRQPDPERSSILQMAQPPATGSASRWRRLAVAAAVAAVLALSGAWGLFERSRDQWARTVALPQIESFIQQGRFGRAVSLAEEAERHLGDDPALAGLWPTMAGPVKLTVDPADAHVLMSRVPQSIASEVRVIEEEEWIDMGAAPIELERLAFGPYRVRISAPGFDTLEVIYRNPVDQRSRPRWWRATLVPPGTVRARMVRIGPKFLSADLFGLTPNHRPTPERPGGDPAYLLSRFEVTNREYKAFVDAGGYLEREYWQNEFARGSDTLTWEEAIATFMDRSGRPGPSTWVGGTYPEGMDDHPVGGVSWYEAAAYAEFAGAQLPTVYHWQGAGEYRGFDMAGFGNYRGEGPAPVGHAPFGPFGIYDLGGNVREWVWNSTGQERHIMGGGWNDPLYLYMQGAYAPPFDRSPKNGIRLADLSEASDEQLAPFRAPLERKLPDAPWGSEPVADNIYEVLANRYEYDPGGLAGAVDSIDDSSRYWRLERVSFNAAYDGERVFGYLFLPKNVAPPFQTLIYFPGAGSIRPGSSERLNAANMIDYVVKAGRAVFHPIYKDTYERFAGIGQNRGPTREYVTRKSRWIKDLRRSVDYLQTRSDIDMERLGYWGLSWGAEHGPIALATEPRLRAAVLMDGGALLVPVLPEADESNFAPRVKQPVLMINGTYDHIFPVQTAQRPFFDLLGTAEEDKDHLLFDSGHVVVNRHFDDVMGAVMAWLNQHLGRVR